MSFSSQTSKLRASSSIDKLLQNVLPSKHHETRSKRSLTAIETLNENFNGLNNKKFETIKKLQKKNKVNKKKLVKKNQIISKKVEDSAKLKIIQEQIYKVKKDHKNKYEKLEYDLTEEEKNFINNQINKNLKTVTKFDLNEEINEEILKLQEEIINLKDEKLVKKGKKSSKKWNKEINFANKKNEKVYPGLTPGLAPVGLDDSDDESD